jgi:hypothetical protein
VYQTPQADTKDPTVKASMKKKLFKIRARAYLVAAFVMPLVSFFNVPKGENDIRLVYDRTKCGLSGSPVSGSLPYVPFCGWS